MASQRLSSVSGFVPGLLPVLRSARCAVAPWAGSALGLSLRASARSLSGWVAVVRFSSSAAAGRFAASWGRRLPAGCRGCVVRHAARGWVVSLPVAPSLCPGLSSAPAARSALSVFI